MQPDRRRLRVLIAEDDPSIRELIKTRLDLGGYEVCAACDGVEALSLLGRFKPSLAVLDVNMPRLDGFDVLRAIRASTPYARMPVLMLTARKSPDDIATARGLGVADYLAKPFDDKQLLQRVVRLASRVTLAPEPDRPTPAAAKAETEDEVVYLDA